MLTWGSCKWPVRLCKLDEPLKLRMVLISHILQHVHLPMSTWCLRVDCSTQWCADGTPFWRAMFCRAGQLMVQTETPEECVTCIRSCGGAAHDSWRAQAEVVADDWAPLGEGAFGSVLPGELGGEAVAIKWALGTDVACEALLREYAFLRSPSLRFSTFIVKVTPPRMVSVRYRQCSHA